MKLFRHLKEKRYLILAFILPAILLALAIVFLRQSKGLTKCHSIIMLTKQLIPSRMMRPQTQTLPIAQILALL